MAKNRPAAHTRAQKAGRLRDDHVEGHHIIDFAFGGAATADNIISLCHKHHKDVHDGKINILKI